MDPEKWTAILNRDKCHDGNFFYGLRTTKKVHRPSCVCKIPAPENVILFDYLADALDQGYLPCRRCRPRQPEWQNARAELAENAGKAIRANYQEDFSLPGLANDLFVNECYLARTFKTITGYTPLEYHNYVRCDISREMLKNPQLKISYISDAVGYNSASYYIRCFRKFFFCTPSDWRKQHFDKKGA